MELPICEGDGPKKSERTVRNLPAFQGAVYPSRACLARNTHRKKAKINNVHCSWVDFLVFLHQHWANYILKM